MTYADNYNIRTTSVKFNDVADALDGLTTRNYIGTTTGTSTAYLASASPVWTEYTTSSFLIVIFHTTNTAGSPSVTINVNNLGAKAIKRSGSDIAAGTIVAGVPAILAYTGVHFEILVVENALARDGSNSMLANLNFGGFLPTNVGAGTAALPAYCAGNDSDTGMFSPAANELGFSTNGVQRIEISSAGRVGINNNTPGFITDIQYTGTDAVTVSQFSADSSPCRLNLRKSRGATVGSNALVSAGDTAGQFIFWGNDGSAYQTAAAISCDIATRTSGMPGVLRFFTTPDTSTTVQERVRIESNGNVGIGTTAPAELLHIRSAAPRIRFEDTDGGSTTIYSAISGNSTVGTLTLQADPGNAAANSTIDFQVDGNTRMSINGSAEVGIGTAPVSGTALEISGRSSITHSSNSSSLSALATFGSYTSLGISSRADRAANAAYQLFTAYSSFTSASDLEFAVYGDGNTKTDGSFTGGGADYAEFFEWADGNPLSEDRRGKSVSLVGNKIKIAEPGEVVVGVISTNPSVVGDAAWNKWVGKYLRDDFNSYIFEDYEVWEWQDSETGKQYSYASDSIPDGVVVPEDKTVVIQSRRKLNPEFDPTIPYTPRAERPEWAAVGLMGKLRLLKGQITAPSWIKLRDISATVEEWLVK